MKPALLWVLCALCWWPSPSQPHVSITQFSIISTLCLNESMSVWRKPHPATSMLNCFVSSRSAGRLNSVGVVQRNRRDASCSLFRFHQLCQLLGLINISSTTGGDCQTLVDSEYDAITANKHFAAVWVGDRGPMLENLVCGPNGQRNLMKSSGVNWSSEGARMHGVTSQLWVDDASGFDFSTSYTWMLHMKRTPKGNCFLELTDCSNEHFKDHLWEYSFRGSTRNLYYHLEGCYCSFESNSVLPSDPQQFFITGVTYERLANSSRLFFGDSFPPHVYDVWSLPYTSPGTGSCIKVGWRSSGDSDGMLNGTVRAVAVANSALPEDIIRRLFTAT